ncbi:MAG: type 1 glutamine amidotransferase [bacterium]|nr:type 1 glutamine amidotransferase [bacterium]
MARIVVPLAEDFEDAELTVPRDRLAAAGHTLTIVGRDAGETVRGKRGRASALVEASAASVAADAFDACLIPGGYSPDHLRTDRGAVALVQAMMRARKPVAAICHGPQLLIDAGAAAGRTLTSYPSVRADLENAGAHWVDREVVVDGALITSRTPDDLDAFTRAFLAALSEGAAAHDA